MNAGVTASLLIDCMAAMPCTGGSRPRAGMTKAENAKKIPADRPQPTAVTSVTQCSKSVIVVVPVLRCERAFRRYFPRANRWPVQPWWRGRDDEMEEIGRRERRDVH